MLIKNKKSSIFESFLVEIWFKSRRPLHFTILVSGRVCSSLTFSSVHPTS